MYVCPAKLVLNSRPRKSSVNSINTLRSLRGKVAEGPKGLVVPGVQTSTNSPPGPNLQSGSIFSDTCMFIFCINLTIESAWRQAYEADCKYFYRQQEGENPNKNRTKNGEFQIFFNLLVYDNAVVIIWDSRYAKEQTRHF